MRWGRSHKAYVGHNELLYESDNSFMFKERHYCENGAEVLESEIGLDVLFSVNMLGLSMSVFCPSIK